jgi:LssY C-terminus
MGLFRSCWRNRSAAFAACFCLAWPALAIQVPAGAEINVRLKTKVASSTSKIKDPVDAMVIQPVMAGGQFVIPAGATVHGVVIEAKPSTGPDDRAMLDVVFNQLDLPAGKVKLVSTVSDVDNARESVNSNGQIQGIVASESISARLDAGIGKVAQRFGGLAGILEKAKSAVLQEPDGNIVYEPGVELTIKLDQPLDLKGAGSGFANLQSVAAESQLSAAVVAYPFQTRAQAPPKPSDMTNLMFIGTQDQLERAFTAAGWSAATANNSISKFETFKAIAESRGYKEAPVSVLLLEGNPPDLVFQKQNNTFTQRHHLRIWRRHGDFRGQPVWVCAATHDIGIDVSPEDRTFIHKVDSQIDRERAKVVNDLLLTGMVKSLALVDRPAVPRESSNATGDKLITDGRMAVIVF